MKRGTKLASGLLLATLWTLTGCDQTPVPWSGKSAPAETGSSVDLVLSPNLQSGRAKAGVTPLVQAHSHNDFHHPRPLLDALDQGFCSFEVDIYLVNGQLLVGYTRDELTPERTIERLYLDPLWERAQQNGGRIYRSGPTVTLLIDVRSEAGVTYAALRGLLSRYREMLSRQQGDHFVPGAVQVVVSGNRSPDTIARDAERLTGVDGRLKDLGSTLPPSVMPLISDQWTSHFRWRGEGSMPELERQKLEQIVDQAHYSGRRVRFWATPESPALWQELYAAGVDHINTDHLVQLRDFLLQQRAVNPDLQLP